MWNPFREKTEEEKREEKERKEQEKKEKRLRSLGSHGGADWDEVQGRCASD